MSEKHKVYIVSKFSKEDITAYFTAKYYGTSLLPKLLSAIDKMAEKDFARLAKSIGDDFKTEYFWDNLEYNFQRLFM